MAGRTVRVVAVRLQFVTKRCLGAFRRIGFDGRHIRRRRRRRLTKEHLAEPDSAMNWAVARAV